MHAVHLTADGASYTGTKEEFLSRSPLPLTDAAVGPDGALYFITGGRTTQSELYRVTYVGTESTAPVDARETRFAELRALRQKTEAYLAPQEDPAEAAIRLIGLLAHDDRHIRYAARVSLERLPLDAWQDRVLSAADPDCVIGGVVGLAHTVEAATQPALLAALERLDYRQLSVRQQLDFLRALSLVFIRTGAPQPQVAARWATALDRGYPTVSDPVNRELCELLVFLRSPTVVAKTLALLDRPSTLPPGGPIETHEPHLISRSPKFGLDILEMMTHPPDPQKIAYVFTLRNLRDAWTPAQRIRYFTWLGDERQKQAGQTFQKFLDNIEADAYENATDADRLAVDAAGLHKPLKAPKLPRPVGPGQDYTVDTLIGLSAAHPTGRNFASGKRAFAAARCVVCHRFDGEGGATGPDLTQAAGRFSLHDLAESIVDPSKIVSDQYRATAIQTEAGQQYVGRVIGETADSITLLIDPEDSTRWIEIRTADIASRTLSPISLMPKNLLNTLNPSEVLDLLAYLFSRGNPQDPRFKP
jgi:putative heme-binding domain-containing protein